MKKPKDTMKYKVSIDTKQATRKIKKLKKLLKSLEFKIKIK